MKQNKSFSPLSYLCQVFYLSDIDWLKQKTGTVEVGSLLWKTDKVAQTSLELLCGRNLEEFADAGLKSPTMLWAELNGILTETQKTSMLVGTLTVKSMLVRIQMEWGLYWELD